MRLAHLSASAFALALAACAPPADETASFSRINRDVFEPNCTFACHSGGEFAAGGLDMASDPYGSLLHQPAMAAVCADTGLFRLVPGDPEASLLYTKIAAKESGAPAPCGDVMPAGAERLPLAEADVAAIRTWIEDGAPAD